MYILTLNGKDTQNVDKYKYLGIFFKSQIF